MLRICCNSLVGQTDSDWEQSFLVDEVGRGVGWAQEQLADYAEFLTGSYIWILDDDDKCVRDTLVAELKGIVRVYDPDVIMLRMDHGPRGVLPEPGFWGKKPACGHCGCSSFVVRREVFQAHAEAWRSARYVSDFDFITAVFESGARVFWHEVIASQVQRIGLGEMERERHGDAEVLA